MPPKRKAPKAHVKCVLVEKGTRFIDAFKKEFLVGKEIGQGGFGRIYEGVQLNDERNVAIKMEPMMNGPLFTEMHIYSKILKESHLAQWKQEHQLRFLGLPSLISSGKFMHAGEELRYIIIPRYYDSVEAALESNGTLNWKNTAAISRCILDAYEYIHHENYVHADVKAGNLLMEKLHDYEKVVLIDFGLARKLSENIVEKEDKKSAHNGTPLFTSCDAHRGCLPTFRGDLEILAHNILFWLTGSSPWKEYETDLPKIYELKKKFISESAQIIPKLIKDRKARNALISLYAIIQEMEYDEAINFSQLKPLFM